MRFYTLVQKSWSSSRIYTLNLINGCGRLDWQFIRPFIPHLTACLQTLWLDYYALIDLRPPNEWFRQQPGQFVNKRMLLILFLFRTVTGRHCKCYKRNNYYWNNYSCSPPPHSTQIYLRILAYLLFTVSIRKL